MRTLKAKHKNEFSYSITDFIKNKSISYEKTKVQYNKPKIPSCAKKQLSGSKSTSQCRKINPEKPIIGSCLADLYSTSEKNALQRISENDTLTGSIKRNRTMTNMIVHQPKGDNDETSERQAKHDTMHTPKNIERLIDGKENNSNDISKWVNEIKNCKCLKTVEERYKATLQTLNKLYNCNNPLSQLIKEVCVHYEEHFKFVIDENKKTVESFQKAETCMKRKQNEYEIEKSNLLKEIKLQQKHIDAQAIVINQLQTFKQQSDTLKNKVLKLTEENKALTQTIHGNDKSINCVKKPVPSLDLSKIRKKEGQLSLIIKPSLYHHSLSSESEDEEDVDKINKTTIADTVERVKEEKAIKVPKLNLYYLKKSI